MVAQVLRPAAAADAVADAAVVAAVAAVAAAAVVAAAVAVAAAAAVAVVVVAAAAAVAQMGAPVKNLPQQVPPPVAVAETVVLQTVPSPGPRHWQLLLVVVAAAERPPHPHRCGTCPRGCDSSAAPRSEGAEGRAGPTDRDRDRAAWPHAAVEPWAERRTGKAAGVPAGRSSGVARGAPQSCCSN